MATLLQKKLAVNIVANAKTGKKSNKKELLVSTGYAVATAETEAKEILESKGVREELENLGFDSESAKKVVKHILTRGKEENRLKAADMIFKIGGDYAAEKHVNFNVPVPIYGGQSIQVRGHDGDQKDISASKED